MSISAISWALKQTTGRSSAKFILVLLANYANEDGQCYPSIARLEKDTEQDRKTIIDNLSHLKEIGLIHDTGERRGATSRVTVYGLGEAVQQTVPKAEPFNSPVFPYKQSRFPPVIVPKTDPSIYKDPTGTYIQPSTEPEGVGVKEVSDEVLEKIPQRVWTDARVAIHALNAAAGRNFREVGDNLLLVARRLVEEGVTIEGVRAMIDRQVKLWQPRPDMQQHLTPHTLFGANFSKYYDDREQPLPVLDGKGKPREKTQREINTERALKQLDRL